MWVVGTMYSAYHYTPWGDCKKGGEGTPCLRTLARTGQSAVPVLSELFLVLVVGGY